jgi:hypothetical protein
MLFPVPRDRFLDGYLLFVGGLLLIGLARTTSRAGTAEGPSPYEAALRRRPRAPGRLRELARLEREVGLGIANAFDLHVRVRPHLRLIAAHRLETRRGLRLDDGSPATRALLGDETWELLRPDRQPPDDRLAPGLPLPRLRAAVERLEEV